MIKTARIRTNLPGLRVLPRARPSFRVAVGILAVTVVVAMAVVLAEFVAGHLRSSATEGAIHNVEAIVRGYVDPQVDEQSLAIDATPDPRISDELNRLTAAGDIRAMNIWSRDGRIVYSTDPELRNRRFSIGNLLGAAFSGTSVSVYGEKDNPELPSRSSGTDRLEIFVPIRGMVDGSPIGVLMVEQDARPIEARVEATRRDVFLVALIGALVLLVVLTLAFGATSALLSRQNRLLRERADKERALMNDLRRSEKRFKSLVRNSSDIILITERDGTVKYESPAVQGVLGYDPKQRFGSSLFDVIHPGDVSWIRSLFGDIARSAGSEATADFRAVHADGTERWLQATVKNLLRDPAVQGIVVNYRDITERRSLEDQLRYQAFHDSLSGLPNRALFMDRLEHALTRARRDQSTLAVLFLDLDDFKAVNDGLGHAAGDELLLAVAQRLATTLRDSDTAARMGGDEFSILLEDVDSRAEAAKIGERVLESLRSPFEIQSQIVRIHGSVGIAVYDSVEQTADELLRRADVAMYAAKTQGKDRLTVFEPDIHLATIGRHQLKADLATALDKGELRLVYQPLVDLETRQTKGFEALMRWRHPRRGEIGPSEFIPLAEESGIIAALSRWALAEACREAAHWPAVAGRAIALSVNLSARQFNQEGLVEDVAHALSAASVDPEQLTLEITESILLTDIETVTARMLEFKSLGVKLAIDDFGTGYSSLSYLRRLPVDVLKIDRSFVAGVDSSTAERALVRSIISLSQVLGLETVAEGIEDESQLDALRAYGATWGQGFLFARPLEVADIHTAFADTGASARNDHGSASTAAALRKGRRRRAMPGIHSSALAAQIEVNN